MPDEDGGEREGDQWPAVTVHLVDADLKANGAKTNRTQTVTMVAGLSPYIWSICAVVSATL